jgi:hypothetical protein
MDDDEDRRRQVGVEIAHQHAQRLHPAAGGADDNDIARGGA